MVRVSARMILEILGKPKDHVSESLKILVDKIDSDKGVSIINKKLHEPRLVEDSKEMFTTFAELEIEFEELEDYFRTMFMYMPSNVEITEPEKLKIDAFLLNEISNMIVGKLHNYDAIAKRLVNERTILVNKLKEVQEQGGFNVTVPSGVEEKPKKETKKTSKKKSSKKK